MRQVRLKRNASLVCLPLNRTSRERHGEYLLDCGILALIEAPVIGRWKPLQRVGSYWRSV